MNFNFPRAKFVDENGLVSQILHMSTEQTEILLEEAGPRKK